MDDFLPLQEVDGLTFPLEYANTERAVTREVLELLTSADTAAVDTI